MLPEGFPFHQFIINKINVKKFLNNNKIALRYRGCLFESYWVIWQCSSAMLEEVEPRIIPVKFHLTRQCYKGEGVIWRCVYVNKCKPLTIWRKRIWSNWHGFINFGRQNYYTVNTKTIFFVVYTLCSKIAFLKPIFCLRNLSIKHIGPILTTLLVSHLASCVVLLHFITIIISFITFGLAVYEKRLSEDVLL